MSTALWLTSTLDVYRPASDGSGVAVLTSDVPCSPLVPYSPGPNLTVAYPNLKPYNTLETYIFSAAVAKGDYIEMDGVKYAVAEVTYWPPLTTQEAMWQIIVEAAA